MDSLRSVGIMQARLREDSDELTWIRWYITDPDAPAYEGQHAFGYPRWDARDLELEGAGVLLSPQIWRPNRYPLTVNFQPVGTPADFRCGLAGPPGPPPAQICAGPGIIAQGAVCACGTAWPPHAFHSQPAVLGGRAEDVAPLAPRVEHSSIVLSGGHPEDAPCIAIGAYWIAYDAAYYRLQCLPSGGTHSAEVQAGGHSADQHAVYTGAYDPDQFSSAWDVFRP